MPLLVSLLAPLPVWIFLETAVEYDCCSTAEVANTTSPVLWPTATFTYKHTNVDIHRDKQSTKHRARSTESHWLPRRTSGIHLCNIALLKNISPLGGARVCMYVCLYIRILVTGRDKEGWNGKFAIYQHQSHYCGLSILSIFFGYFLSARKHTRSTQQH